MPTSYALILGLIALIITIVAFAKKMKKNTRMTLAIIGIIGLIVGGYAYVTPGAIPFLDQTFDTSTLTAGVEPGQPSVSRELCPVEDTTVTFTGIDKYTSQPSGGTHRYWVNSDPALTVSDQGTKTLSPGDRVKVLFGNETATSFFGSIEEETIPCAGTHTISGETVRNGTLTLRVFNDDDVLIVAGTSTTLEAGETQSLDIDLQGSHQYGAPYGGIIVAEYDKNNFTDVTVDFGAGEVSVPTIHTVSSTTNVAKAYRFPVLEQDDKILGKLRIEVKSGIDDVDTSVNISLQTYNYDYYLDEDLGGIIAGPSAQDEDSTIISTSGGTVLAVGTD